MIYHLSQATPLLLENSFRLFGKIAQSVFERFASDDGRQIFHPSSPGRLFSKDLFPSRNEKVSLKASREKTHKLNECFRLCN